MLKLFRRRHTEGGMGPGRTELFSDAVFAIAITLLILEIRVPEIAYDALGHGELTSALVHLWPKFLSYIISFLIIGTFWVGHHLMFKQIKRVDRTFLFLNLILLLLIAFIPFPASVIGEYPLEQSAVVLYGATLTLVGFMMLFMWLYATKNKRLVDKDLSASFISKAALIVFAAPVIYIIAVLLSFINPKLSLIIYILVPILYTIPSPIDDLLDGK